MRPAQMTLIAFDSSATAGVNLITLSAPATTAATVAATTTYRVVFPGLTFFDNTNIIIDSMIFIVFTVIPPPFFFSRHDSFPFLQFLYPIFSFLGEVMVQVFRFSACKSKLS
jgi:hypothetical protein